MDDFFGKIENEFTKIENKFTIIEKQNFSNWQIIEKKILHACFRKCYFP